jgi:hypothetical protein
MDPQSPEHRQAALIQLFEKLGVPLVNAITAVEMWRDPDTQVQQGDQDIFYASTLASLLNRSVALSTELTKKLELTPTSDEKHRIDLAGVSSMMVAHQYALTARVPEETDVPKITASFETVLSFADYFSTKQLKHNSELGEEDLLVEAMEAFVPLVQTIGRFAFGRNQNTLVSEVLEQLSRRVDDMTDALGADISAGSFRRKKMDILKSAAQLFTLCYEAEMNVMIHKQGGDTLNPAATGVNDEKIQETLDIIWQQFDARITLLRGVLSFINDYFTQSEENGTQKNVAASPSQSSQQAVQSKKSEGKPDIFKQYAPEQSKEKREEEEKEDRKTDDSGSQDESSSGGFNPMTFFGAPKDNEE